MDLITLRNVLLISLSLLVLILLYQRFRRRAVIEGLPAVQHAELLELEVAYHPARLRVRIAISMKETLRTVLLDQDYEQLHTWADESCEPGTQELERLLPALADGLYHLEMGTTTQRTIRQFRLQQA